MAIGAAGWRIRPILALGLSITMGLACVQRTATGFALLDFPSEADVLINRHAHWFYGSDWFGTGMGDVVVGEPFVLSFRISSTFMAGQANVTPEAARQAALAAMQSWSAATRGGVTFAEAPWSAVLNGSSQSAAQSQPGPATNVYQWEGPGIDEWTADWLSGDPIYGLETLPGWGANVEFFSRPNGWVFWSEGIQYNMHSGTLGFAVVTRDSPNNARIVSVDIYLNSSKPWRTDGSAQGFDVETALLHELGHAFGLDHPNEAASEGGASLDPCTYAFGAPVAPGAVMIGGYQGVKRSLTLDDIGGTGFLTPGPGAHTPQDLSGDGRVDGLDLGFFLSDWGPVSNQSDFNGDGIVDGIDLGILLQFWGPTPCGGSE